jgi:hypothetical protein
LLLLGNGASVIGCVGNGSTINVNGLAGVNSTSNGSVSVQNSNLNATGLYTADQSNPPAPVSSGPNGSVPASQQTGTPLPDPYETTLPGDGDGDAGGPEPITPPGPNPTNPPPVGNTYQPGTYTSQISLSGGGTYTFASGVYILQGGIKLTGGASIQSGPGGVLFYVSGGIVDTSGGGNVNLAALPNASGYENVVIWVSENDTNPNPPTVSLGGNGTVTAINGVLYAPTATISTGGTGTITVRTMVANKLACNGNATTNVTGNGVIMTAQPLAPSIVVNTPNTDQVTISGNPVGFSPTGTVQFYVCGPAASSCSNLGSAVGAAQALVPNDGSGANGVATVTSPSFTPTSAGTWCFAAYYTGSGSHPYPNTSDTTNDQCFVVNAVANPPHAIAIASAPNPKDGTPDNPSGSNAGDQIVYTFSTTMSPGSILTGFTGASKAVTAHFAHCAGSQGPDCLTVTGSNLGSVALGGQYVKNGSGKTVDVNATISMATNGSGQSVLTLTLVQTPGGGSDVQADTGSYAMVWTPSTSATDTSSNAMSAAPVTESSSVENF